MIKTVLGLIPARGGSKSIPKKNIVPLAGKPLIWYSIQALKRSKHIDKIIVSTDDEEIARVARECGAEVPFLRPVELSTDTSKVFDALQYTLRRLEEEFSYVPNYVVTVQPTSPLVRTADIDKGIELAFEKGAESVITAEHLPHRYHPHNIRFINPERNTRFWMEKEHYEVLNRQQRPSFFAFGNLYITRFDVLKERGRLEGEDNYHVLIDPYSSLDVDSTEDLELIELLLKEGRVTKSL